MNIMWSLKDFRAITLATQIGFRNGLKIGERFTDKEFKEVALRHPTWIEKLGATELNLQELANEYASHDKKVLMIKEKNENNN